MPRKKRRQTKTFPLTYYVVQITDWDWSYSFSVNAVAYRDEQFSDYRHLQIRGTLLRPRKIKVETVELFFLPDIGRAEMERRDLPPPRAVGSLYIRETALIGNLSMPTDALDPVMQMLLADRLKYVALDGEPMRWRKALIRHYEIKTQHNEEDYPDDEY
jgi:hypothetical protein